MVTPITGRAALNMGFGNILSGMMQGEETARKRQMESLDFAMRLAQLQDQQELNKERLKQAQEARTDRETQRNRYAALAKSMYADPASRLREMASAVSPETQITSALDIEEGPPQPGPLAGQTTNFLEEQIKNLLMKQEAALASPEKFGEELFRKPDTLSPAR